VQAFHLHDPAASEHEVGRVDASLAIAAPMRRLQRQPLAGLTIPQWLAMKACTRSRARCRRLR
jgi:hypothetical protein